jgi:hypothetical protein
LCPDAIKTMLAFPLKNSLYQENLSRKVPTNIHQVLLLYLNPALILAKAPLPGHKSSFFRVFNGLSQVFTNS